MPAKNLLMFSIDDMRAVSDWGHFTPLIETPSLDRLAAMGTTFERAITQVPLCNASRTSVLTGQQPSKTGVLDNTMPWYEQVDPAQTMPAVLKAAGAYVAMYGKNFHTAPISAASRAVMFDEFMEAGSDGSAAQVIRDEVYHNGPYQSGRYGGSIASLADERTAAAAVDFLQTTANEIADPFFLSVGITKPHLNWWIPSAFFDLYDPGQIRSALERSLADGTIIPGDGEYFDVPPMSEPTATHSRIGADMDLWADYIHAYLAAISYADSKVGEVLDALAADPALAAETAIVLWSDHGYHLGDRDRWGKFSHWKEATEVPFIVVDPDAPGGRTADQIVSLVDIFPTVLDLMGVEAPRRLELDGTSLAPIVEDVTIDWYEPAAGKGVAVTTIDGSVSIRVQVPDLGDFRYTRYADGTQELYDITNDPGEHVNRIDFATGDGLTRADDRLHAKLSALMDQQLAQVGVMFSDGDNDVVGGAGDEMLVSTNGPGRNVLAGGDGDDTYYLYAAATVTEKAGGGKDTVVVANESLEKGFVLPAHVERVQVEGGVTGNYAANALIGGADPGVLRGRGGDDTLYGGGGDDVLVGGAAADALTGGLGADSFDFNRVSDSARRAPDVVTRFEGPGAAAGDRVDLSGIDADARLAGDQAFAFGGASTGRVRAVDRNGRTEILGNTDADAAPELRIVIEDGSRKASAYAAADFIL